MHQLEDLVESVPRSAMLGPLEITVAAPGVVTVDAVEAYARIGVSRLVVGPDTTDGSEPDRFIEAFQHDVLGHVTSDT
jgi:3-keto-L-gulonate-6-phosphate decarboxylase